MTTKASSSPWAIGAGANMTALLESVDDPLGLIDAAISGRPAVVLESGSQTLLDASQPPIPENLDFALESLAGAMELSPLHQLQTVLAREREGAPDLATAIEMMTVNPARLLRHADLAGSIEPGKFADLVVLDRNLFDVPAEAIGSVGVVATLLQGEAVFDPSGLFDE